EYPTGLQYCSRPLVSPSFPDASIPCKITRILRFASAYILYCSSPIFFNSCLVVSLVSCLLRPGSCVCSSIIIFLASKSLRHMFFTDRLNLVTTLHCEVVMLHILK